MEFTHQSLNKDMNSGIKERKPSNKDNDQFRDFLSIVD